MVKLRESFAADDIHREVIRRRSQSLGITRSEYIRTLVERDSLLEWQATGADDAKEWKKTRQTTLATPSLLSVLEALKREFDSKVTNHKPSSRLKDFAVRYGFTLTEVLEALQRLTRAEIFIKEEGGEYTWTHKGVILLPELAPLLEKEDGLVHGSVAGALSKLLGDYDELVEYMSKALSMNAGMSEQVVKYLLNFAVEYLAWLVDFIFPLNGIPEMEDVRSWREYSLSFLLDISVTFLDHSSDDSDEKSTISDLASRIVQHKSGGRT